MEELAANLQELSSLSTEVEDLKSSLASLTETVQSVGQAVQALEQKNKEQDAAIAALDVDDPSQLLRIQFYSTILSNMMLSLNIFQKNTHYVK